MTAAAATFPVRVMVADVWDQVTLAVGPDTTAADLKRQALERALGRAPADEYLLKFRGAEVRDEGLTLGALGAGPGAPFIVLPRRRRPVR
ncbi:MAG TPA: hypothetical protein VNI61_03675 [Gemmatimonadales bacterium]|nr:hypothetical protein [Gemmatimonadales bacterium]